MKMKKIFILLSVIVFVNIVTNINAYELTGELYTPNENQHLTNLYGDFYLFKYNDENYIFDKNGYVAPRLYCKETDDFFFENEKATSYKLVNDVYMAIYNQEPYNEVFIMGDSWKQYSDFYVRFYDMNFKLLNQTNLKSYISDYGYQDGAYYCILSTGTGTKHVTSTDMVQWKAVESFKLQPAMKKINNIYFTRDTISFDGKQNFYDINYENQYIGRAVCADTDIPLVFSFVTDNDTANLYISEDKINYVKVSLNNLFETGELEKYNGFSPISCWYFENDNLILQSMGDKLAIIDGVAIKSEMEKLSFAPYIKYKNKILAFEVPPVIQDDRTLIPIRFLFEQMGAEVDWNDATKTATVSQNGMSITFAINEADAKINGQTVTMDVPAQLINGKTMVPVRFLSENLGYTVEWDGENRIITIE